MNIFTQLYYKYRRMSKAMKPFLLTAGPGIIVIVAEDDGGCTTTYTTGDQHNIDLPRDIKIRKRRDHEYLTYLKSCDSL